MDSAEEHKPPRVMPQLMQYFKAIKVGNCRSFRCFRMQACRSGDITKLTDMALSCDIIQFCRII